MLLLPVGGCDAIGALGPDPALDPLAGAIAGEGTTFEGQVAVVDLERSAIVLSSGLRVEVGVDTEISAEHEIESLEVAAAWLAEGHEVAAWGEGTVSSEDPPVLLASTLTMALGALPDEEEGEKGEEDEEEPEPGLAEYEGVIIAVDVEAGTVSLDGGTTIRVLDGTEISDDFGIPSLAAAKEHLEAGDVVFGWGKGELESEDPRVIAATHLAMKVKSADESSHHVEYEGHVVGIDVEAGTLSLDGGTTIRVVEATEISDDFGIPSLAAAKEHLEAGASLAAWGKGELESEDPRVIAALKLAMKVVD